ncbi:MAG: competence/damage-inducible protein A [Eubacteriales bacterium]|nr:competence/damage-inducible protein A [Eubacteriales bacterium]
MTAEILSVGTELLLGQIANTDAQYLSRHLSALGIAVYRHSVVGDNPGRLQEAFEQALDRSDIVITTGGLGPTMDDLTKETIAQSLGLPLQEHAPSLKAMQDFFAGVGREVTPNNIKQAWFPKGSIVLANERGTAPGCIIESRGKVVIILPGPPRELSWVYENQVVPYLENRTGLKFISCFLRFYGIGESALENEVADLMAAQTNPTIAPYAGSGEVQLRITASAHTTDEAQALIEPVKAQIVRRVGQYLYTDRWSSLAETVVQALLLHKKTIAVAESCTGGMVASALVDYAGVSDSLLLGVVTYSNQSKIDLLGVRRESLEAHGAVSAQTAQQMAEGALRVCGADVAVATTGIAGPGGGTAEKPVGLVYIAVAVRGGQTQVKRYRFARERNYVRHSACLAALDMVRRAIEH